MTDYDRNAWDEEREKYWEKRKRLKSLGHIPQHIEDQAAQYLRSKEALRSIKWHEEQIKDNLEGYSLWVKLDQIIEETGSD